MSNPHNDAPQEPQAETGEQPGIASVTELRDQIESIELDTIDMDRPCALEQAVKIYERIHLPVRPDENGRTGVVDQNTASDTHARLDLTPILDAADELHAWLTQDDHPTQGQG